MKIGDSENPPPSGEWVTFRKNERIPDWVFPITGNYTNCRFGTDVKVTTPDQIPYFVPIGYEPGAITYMPPGDVLWYNPDVKYWHAWPESEKVGFGTPDKL